MQCATLNGVLPRILNGTPPAQTHGFLNHEHGEVLARTGLKACGSAAARHGYHDGLKEC